MNDSIDDLVKKENHLRLVKLTGKLESAKLLAEIDNQLKDMGLDPNDLELEFLA